MNTINIKCSGQNHDTQKVFKFCYECNIFMCNQCFNYHSKLFNKHHLLDINENMDSIFTGFCKEESHSNKLEYFCKTHNQLCCLSCLGKDTNKENTKHQNCETFRIEEIKEEKRSNLEKNIKLLEVLSNNIKESGNKLKNCYEIIDEFKEELKSKIMKMITNIRNKLNEREDELLSQLESTFLNLYPPEKIMKDYEKLPKKINDILEKRKEMDEKFNNSILLSSYINDCINIENDLGKINEINDSIKKYDINSNNKVYFFPEENEIDKIYKNIKSFGKIYQKEIDKESFFITESEKENNELVIKIKELEKEIENLKDIKENEYNNLKNNFDEIKFQLDKERANNDNLSKQLKNSKICFTMRSKCALNKCLDTKSLTYGNSPHLWDYGHNNANQIFELEKNDDGTYSIKNTHSGLYLGMDNDKIAFRNKNENAQSFDIHHFEDGYYLFQEKGGGVIDLSNFETNNGANIGKCGRNDSDAQQWKLVIHL